MSHDFDLRKINNIAISLNSVLSEISLDDDYSSGERLVSNDSMPTAGIADKTETSSLDSSDFDDISISSPGSSCNRSLNLPLILKQDPNFALFQFGKRLLLKLNAFRMYLELKHHHAVLPKLVEIISRGSAVLKDYALLDRRTLDTEDDLKRYFEIPSAEILSKLDEVFSQLNLQDKNLLSAKIKPDLTFEDKEAANKVLKIVQEVCVNSLKCNGHNPPPFTQLESFSFLSYPETISNSYDSEVDFTQLAARDSFWKPILDNIISNTSQAPSLSSQDKASLRLSLFMKKLDSVLENPSKYLRPHPFYLHWAALSADEVVEKGGVYSFSCKSGKDRTSMAVEVRAVHFAIKAVEKVFDEFKSGHKSNSNLTRVVREKLEKLKVKITHKKVTDLTPLQIQEFHNVYSSSFSPKPQWYDKMRPDLQRLLDQLLAKCFVPDGKVLDFSIQKDYKEIKQNLDKYLGWDSPLGQYLPIATNLFRVDFKASLDGEVILSERAFRHGALVKNEMMGNSPEIQRVSDLVYGQITNAMLGAASSSISNDSVELRLIALLTPLKILNPAKDDNEDFLKHMDKSIENMHKNFPSYKSDSESFISAFVRDRRRKVNRSREVRCKLTSRIVPVDTGFAPLQNAHMIREHCSFDRGVRGDDTINSSSYDLQDMVSFLIYNELFEDSLGGELPFENISNLLKDLSSSVLASGAGDLVPAIFGAAIKGRLKRGGLCPEAHIVREEQLKQVAKQVKQDSGGKCKPELFRNLVHNFFGANKDAGFSYSIPLFSPLLSDPARVLLNDVLNKAFVKSGIHQSFGDFEIKPGQSEFSVNQIALIKLIAPNLKRVISGASNETELVDFISWAQSIEKTGFCFLKQAEPERCTSPLFLNDQQNGIEYFWDISPDILEGLRGVVKNIKERKPKCSERSSLGGYLHDLTQHLYKLKDEGVYAGVRFADLKELGACLVLEAHLNKDSLSEGCKLLNYRGLSNTNTKLLDRIKPNIYSRPQLEKKWANCFLPISLKSIPWFLSLLTRSSLSCCKAIVCLPLVCCLKSGKNPEVAYDKFFDKEEDSALNKRLKSLPNFFRCSLNYALIIYRLACKAVNIFLTAFLNLPNLVVFVSLLVYSTSKCCLLEFLTDVKKQSHRYIRSYPDVVLIAIFDFDLFMQLDLEVLRMLKDDKPRYDYTIYSLSFLSAMPAFYYLLKTMCWDRNHISSKLDRIIKSESFDSKDAAVFREAGGLGGTDVRIDINADGKKPLLSADSPKIYL